MHNQTKSSFLNWSLKRALIAFIAILVVGLYSCDQQITRPEPAKPKSEQNLFFSVHPDSIGPLLHVAIDSLRKRQSKYSFVE